MKTKRNDPCPCGSGKKFKKCCIPRYVSKPKAKPDPKHKLHRNQVGLLLSHMMDLAEPPPWPPQARRLPPESLDDLE